MSGCNGLCGRLAAWMHSGGWEPAHYKRLKSKLLSTLEGEVIEIGPSSGVNLKYYRDNVRWTSASRRRARRSGPAGRSAPRVRP